MNENDFRELLRHRESDVLDFKKTAYTIRGASDREKAELVKDVMAFANAPRSQPAHILLGVDDDETPPKLIGISPEDHQDDATFQQLINSKLNRAIQFAYQRFVLNGLHAGAIVIPATQERPFFLTRPFGGLLPKTAYIRRGTSTDIADPDEVTRMGNTVNSPSADQLRLEFANGEMEELLGTSVRAQTVQLVMPAKGSVEARQLDAAIARERTGDYYDPLASGYRMSRIERQFHRLRNAGKRIGVSLALCNDSAHLVHDVRAAFFLAAAQGVEVPEDQFRSEGGKLNVRNLAIGGGCRVDEKRGGWLVTMLAKKLQARDVVVEAGALVLSVDRPCKLTLDVRIAADELTAPLSQTLTIEIASTPQLFTADMIRPG